MGAKQSSTSTVNGRSGGRHSGPVANGVGDHSRVVSLDPRTRTRSLNSVEHSLSIPSHQGSFQESDLSSSNDDNSPQLRNLYTIQGAHSLPAQLFATSFITGKIKRINQICSDVPLLEPLHTAVYLSICVILRYSVISKLHVVILWCLYFVFFAQE
jgi:hypothetical protein